METEYNGIYISCDGCRFCDDQHRETKDIISKYVKRTLSLNVDDDNLQKKYRDLLNEANPKKFPTFLVYRKIDKNNVYIGRVIGYPSKQTFLDSIDKVKANWEKNNKPLTISFGD